MTIANLRKANIVRVYRDKWVILALCFFILWKFLLISVMWQERALPPEPDDSLTYSGHIYSVIRCPQLICNTPYISTQRPDGYHYLSYRLFWGILAKISHIDSMSMYRASFYLGTAAMAFVLTFLLSKLTTNRKLIAFSLAVLALFFGAGSWHGFFWVVPSFFAVLLFFWLFALLYVEKKDWRWRTALIALSISLVFVHPTGIYLIFLLPIYAAIRRLLPNGSQKKVSQAILIIIASSLLAYVPVQYKLSNNPLPYSSQPKTLIADITSTFNGEAAEISVANPPTADLTVHSAYWRQFYSGWQRFQNDYIDWLFPTSLGAVIYIIFFLLLWRARQFRLIALYLAALVFTVVSFFHPLGGRSIIVLWPVTFIVYAFGFWYSFSYIAQRAVERWRKTAAFSVVGVTFTLFILANLLYSFLFADFMRQRGNIAISGDFVPYVLAHTNNTDPVLSSDKTLSAYLMNTELTTRPLGDIADFKTKMVLSFQPTVIRPTGATGLDEFLAVATTLFTGKVPVTPIDVAPATPPAPLDPRLVLRQQFTHVGVYENTAFTAAPNATP